MRRINTVEYLGCSELLGLILFPWKASKWREYGLFLVFYSNIVRVSLWRENTIMWVILVLIRMFLCSGGNIRLGLNIQANFPLELLLALPVQAQVSCLQRACCLPWMGNRHGSQCIGADLRCGIVIPSYVCTPDVLLTSIDFFTRGTFFFLKKGNLAGVKGIAGDESLMNSFFPFLWLLFNVASYSKCLNCSFIFKQFHLDKYFQIMTFCKVIF